MNKSRSTCIDLPATLCLYVRVHSTREALAGCSRSVAVQQMADTVPGLGALRIEHY